MLSIAHGTTGAFIASKIPNPIISVPLVIASHFLEDRVPHWDVGQGLGKKIKTKKDAFIQELIFDFPLSIILVYLIFQIGQPFNWHIWLGWFCGLLPDFLEFPSLFLGIKIPGSFYLTKVHKYVHRSIPDKFWGLLPQFLVILLAILFR
jgi:hypothetical protein